MASKYFSVQTNLTGSGDTLVYTCPPSTSTIILTAVGTNVGTEIRQVDAHLVLGGGAGAATNRVVDSRVVDTADDEFLEGIIGLALSAGDQIRCNLDNTGNVNVTVAVREIV